MTGRLGAALAGLVATVAVLVGAVGGVLSPGDGAAPSSRAAQDIPPAYQRLYVAAAGTCPGLPWTVLAAVGQVETDHGRSPRLVSTAGAVGPMQFLPATFAVYQVDGDGDGRADPNSPADAVYTAARYLCASGARGGADIPTALWRYNHDDAYVSRVLTVADAYTDSGAPAPTQAALTAVDYATAQLGLPYAWGGNGPGNGDDGFDCSGLTKAAYTAAGITVPRVAQDQYNAGPRIPDSIPLAPGDLLFYGASTNNVTHVGIYVGNGQMVDAPHTGATIRREPYRRRNYLGATRPAYS